MTKYFLTGRGMKMRIICKNEKKCHSIKCTKKITGLLLVKVFLNKSAFSLLHRTFFKWGALSNLLKLFSMLRFNTKVFHLTFNIQASRPLKTKFFIWRSQLLLRVEFPSEFSKNSTVICFFRDELSSAENHILFIL